MRALTLLAVAALVTLPFAGCIENMDDLKDRLQRSAATDEGGNLTDLANETLPAGNVTGNGTEVAWKPPVARITVFDGTGALVYKADFGAENQTEPVIVNAGMVSLVGGDSEVLEANATITSFTWDVNGEAHEGRQVDVDLSEPGIHMIVLTVTDSRGGVDSQMIHLGVPPEPFTVTQEIEGGAAVGAEAASGDAGSPSTIEFTVLSEQDGKPLKVQEIKVTGTAENPTVDAILVLTSPSGAETRVDSRFVQAAEGPESATLAGGESGVWHATLRMFAGATPSWTASVEVTYVQDVPGLSGGDGHAHAH